jgi:hypothetical protein
MTTLRSLLSIAGLCAGLVSAQPAAPAGEPVVRIGAGLAAGFGGLAGLVAELEFKRMAGLVALGTWNETTFEVGGRYYFADVGRKLRPHATVTYAPTHEIEYGPTSADTRKSLVYGVNVLGGLDHDFRKPGGFLMSYMIGLAFPGEVSDEVKDFFAAANQPAPEADIGLTFGLGLRYQF